MLTQPKFTPTLPFGRISANESANSVTPELKAEEALINKAIHGDLNAYNELVLTYQDTVYRRAYSILGDQDSAEDVTQDVFIRAFQALGEFRGGSFRGWLMKITMNGAYDLLRRAKRHPNQPLYPTDDNGAEVEVPKWLIDPAQSVESTIEQNEAVREVYQWLSELPEGFRSVITLIDLYEYDYSEAAEALNIPVGTVKSRLARARLQMQKKLREHKKR